jgi:hypothetical protein
MVARWKTICLRVRCRLFTLAERSLASLMLATVLSNSCAGAISFCHDAARTHLDTWGQTNGHGYGGADVCAQAWWAFSRPTVAAVRAWSLLQLVGARYGAVVGREERGWASRLSVGMRCRRGIGSRGRPCHCEPCPSQQRMRPRPAGGGHRTAQTRTAFRIVRK